MVNGTFRDEVKAMITDINSIREGQSSSESILGSIYIENETLWREVDILRTRHQKQQKVVDKVIQFLLSLISGDQKRDSNLMINSLDQQKQQPEDLDRRRQEHQQQSPSGSSSSPQSSSEPSSLSESYAGK